MISGRGLGHTGGTLDKLESIPGFDIFPDDNRFREIIKDVGVAMVEKERVKRFPIESRLFHKLSTRHRLAYVEAVSKLPSDSPEFPLWEYYYRCRLLQDYISGMTDLYAWDEYRRLMAVEQ